MLSPNQSIYTTFRLFHNETKFNKIPNLLKATKQTKKKENRKIIKEWSKESNKNPILTFR